MSIAYKASGLFIVCLAIYGDDPLGSRHGKTHTITLIDVALSLGERRHIIIEGLLIYPINEYAANVLCSQFSAQSVSQSPSGP